MSAPVSSSPQGPVTSLMNLDQVLPLMFQVVISNAGHLNETYHLTLGLLGQLVRRLPPAEVDAAVTKVLSAKHSLFAAGDGSALDEGWKTIHLLFSLGAVCLDRCVFPVYGCFQWLLGNSWSTAHCRGLGSCVLCSWKAGQVCGWPSVLLCMY